MDVVPRSKPMPGSVIKLGPRADANKVSSHSSGWQSVCLTVLADQSGSAMLPALLSALLLLLAGDVETNPGPGRKKEPTAKEIQEAKIASHDEKIEALEKIVKEQKKMLAEMSFLYRQTTPWTPGRTQRSVMPLE